MTVADTIQVPERLLDQPELSQQVWVLFHHHGRPYEEIAPYLGIGRAEVERRRKQACYAILDEEYPSLASRIRFALMVKRLSLEWRWEMIRFAIYG
ncbi:hypothetical protein SKP52_21795 [Sphingopyxis fribergensis]|uniref:RNA polymerase sigma factor 70 region 4 type 2 domain-containing protein n=1 Tax=Sphingopyxis fribergensis TaxID=1515612 RepID=A0A0A7PT47_9SPHN|nr:hypothetical protein [Sphingopyxis fribergensis]AJA11212.1 hypothetical protein SKP52_21795 [Sphingopyxis fribergensis]